MGVTMKESLQPGIEHELRFRVSPSKTVAALYPEATEFQVMPEVLATGFLVGLLEWACIRAVNPHIDWPREQTVGTHVNVSHEAATPPGLEVSARVRLANVDGRRLVFEVEVSDGVEIVSRGSLERFVVDAERFAQKAVRKHDTS
jgi:fluoroacetyl-CoA thioesterase